MIFYKKYFITSDNLLFHDSNNYTFKYRFGHETLTEPVDSDFVFFKFKDLLDYAGWTVLGEDFPQQVAERVAKDIFQDELNLSIINSDSLKIDLTNFKGRKLYDYTDPKIAERPFNPRGSIEHFYAIYPVDKINWKHNKNKPENSNTEVSQVKTVKQSTESSKQTMLQQWATMKLFTLLGVSEKVDFSKMYLLQKLAEGQSLTIEDKIISSLL